ncbi:uncharacterized protein LOC115884142 [Sitophilus oryzae]|uniref:Uncharacterized protein LOC115884142 n=1 Tax=Sitophilus oryzae TaxID=7048 RepID=A0A6J2Y630_SITOR|nr:uncharacterized protein LOC115884142 [Sitophilus oryzae]
MKSNTLKFRDLDNIVDIYALNLRDNENVFGLQAKESNRLISKTLRIQEKLRLLQEKIENLNSFQKQTDLILHQVKCNLCCIEDMIGNAEAQCPKMECCKRMKNALTDLYRQDTYKLVENTEVTITNLQQGLDQISSQIQQNSVASPGIEKIAEILQVHLQNLEEIEQNTEQVKAKLNEVEYWKNFCLHLYKLKEIKPWE